MDNRKKGRPERIKTLTYWFDSGGRLLETMENASVARFLDLTVTDDDYQKQFSDFIGEWEHLLDNETIEALKNGYRMVAHREASKFKIDRDIKYKNMDKHLFLLLKKNRFNQGVQFVVNEDSAYHNAMAQRDEIISELESVINEKDRLVKDLESAMQEHELFTRGILHDFKTPLVLIGGFADRLKKKYPNDNYANIIVSSTKRLESILKQVNQYSGKQNTNPEVFDINHELINYSKRDFPQMAQHLNVILKTGYHDGQLYVNMDKTCSYRLINNFVNNALFKAEELPKGKKLTIGIYSDKISLPDGKYAVIDVIDDGGLIKGAHLGKILEPMFTTKKSRGTGLGLAVCSKILGEVGGKIEIINVPEQNGVRARGYIPLTEPKIISSYR